MKLKFILLYTIFAIFLTGCSTVNNKALSLENINKIFSKKSQLHIRDIQTKKFYNITAEQIEKAIIYTLIDENYFITVVNSESRLVSGITTKEDLDLKLVVSYRENLDNSFTVRFSISIIENTSSGDKFIIVQDDKVYEYLFDRLNKSIFLEQQLYSKKRHKKNENQTRLQLKDKELINIYPYYTIQFTSAMKKESAQYIFNQVRKYDSNVTMKKLNKYYVVRLGKFKSKKDAYLNHQNIFKSFKSAEIIQIGKK